MHSSSAANSICHGTFVIQLDGYQFSLHKRHALPLSSVPHPLRTSGGNFGSRWGVRRVVSVMMTMFLSFNHFENAVVGSFFLIQPTYHGSTP